MAGSAGYTALLCPACGQGQLLVRDGELSCRQCKHDVPSGNGVHAFSLGSEPPESADLDDVTRAFFPSEAARRNHARDLEIILEQVLGRRHMSEVLEIGAGGGAWTPGLSQSDRIRRLYVSETSAASLIHLVSVAAAPSTIILQSSLETIDFAPGSLDLVLGRGTLCRTSDPGETLSRIRQWLKPGGTAIFLEPCLQGKIWAAFAMDLIRRFEKTGMLGEDAPAPSGGFLGRKAPAKKSLSALAQMRLEGGVGQILRGAEAPRHGEERVFDVSTLCGTGYETGYSDCYPIDQPQNEITPMRRMRNTLEGLLGHEKAVLERYAPVFEAIEATFGELPETALVAPMIYFVFRA